jgi:hypothetical protein
MCSVYLVTLSVISLGKVFFDSPPKRASVLARGRGSLDFAPLSSSSLGKEAEVLKNTGEEHVVFGLPFPS